MTDTKEVTISKTFSLGDAGWPFDADIHVSYTETADTITVLDAQESDCPENPPSYWADMIGEAIEDYFETKKVIFA